MLFACKKPFIKMHDPPRHTPVSIKSPSIFSRTTVSIASCNWFIRSRPIMLCAALGQSIPSWRSLFETFGFTIFKLWFSAYCLMNKGRGTVTGSNSSSFEICRDAGKYASYSNHISNKMVFFSNSR
ncbi:Uncharacterised protein [Streptococcus pneumoniae]|nr:Uncharacterised protein [Streptococcus pneumoniae]